MHFRENRISVTARGRISIPQGLPVRLGVPRVPLHPVHPPFVGSVLHAGAGLLPRALGSHAAAGQSHVCAVLAGAGTHLTGSERRGHQKIGDGKLCDVVLLRNTQECLPAGRYRSARNYNDIFNKETRV